MKVLGIVLVALILAGVVFVVANPPGDLAAPRATGNAQTVDIGALYNPFRAGEEMPSGYRQVLGRDVIAPIYDPTFVPATDTPWDDDTLVIGVAIGDESKAYPVSLLNRREMVVDSLAGIPVLVTW